MKTEVMNIWDGIYERLDAVPARGAGFAGERWRLNCVERFLALQERIESDSAVPSRPAYSESLLPVIIAMCSKGGVRTRILDFGGGLGESYLLTRAAIPAEVDFVFHILEVPEVCEAGRELHGANGPVFLTSMPEEHSRYDIVHMGSSVQYIEDWQGLLASVARLTPQYLLFTDLIAGDIPTFASGQTYYDSVIPMWFFNRDEFVRSVKKVGYKPVFSSRFQGTFLGKVMELPLDNFPDSHALRWSCNMLFVPSGGD